MKKIIALVAAAAFVLSLAGMASAAHQGRANLKTKGFIQTGIGFADSTNFQENGGDTFVADQRVRQYFDYVASENLSATMAYEFDTVWGDTAAADVSADRTNLLELKRAQMKFTVPQTEMSVTSGIQFISLPSVAMGYNPVLAGDMAGVSLTSPMGDMADLTLGWTRGYDSTANHAAPGLDTFFATLPLSQDGFSLAPFAAYSVIGEDTDTSTLSTGSGSFASGFTTPNGQIPLNDSASAYWVGSNVELTQMDPISVQASLIYGALQTDNNQNERAGWYADFNMDYKMPSMTPAVFAMYSSGEDDDASDGSETMPWIYNDGLTSKAPSMMVGDMTTLGITSAGVGLLQSNPVGLWAAGVMLKEIQLSDAMSATVVASYYQGTNDQNVNLSPMDNALTDEDSAWDVGVSSNYEIYENLSAIMEAGYAKLDLDSGNADEPATRFALGLQYSF